MSSEELFILASCFFSPMSKNSVLEQLRYIYIHIHITYCRYIQYQVSLGCHSSTQDDDE